MYLKLKLLVSLTMLAGVLYAGFIKAPLYNIPILSLLFTIAYIDSKYSLWITLKYESNWIIILKSLMQAFIAQLIVVSIVFLIGSGLANLFSVSPTKTVGFEFIWFSLIILIILVSLRVHENFFGNTKSRKFKASPEFKEFADSLSKLLGKLERDSSFPEWLVSSETSLPYFDHKAFKFVLIDIEEDPAPQEFVEAASNFLKLTTEDRKFATPYVFKNYTDFMDAVDIEDFDFRIEEEKDVWDHVHPDQIEIQRRYYGDEKVYVKIAAGCDWEEEHALQIVYREGKELCRVSEQDGHLTTADACGLPEEEDRICY